jgi:RecA/RadA recombinase
MSLLEQLKKNSTIKETDVLNKSKFFNKKDMIQTSVPAINVALSGTLDGGLTPGLTVIAGPSKHFKTSFALVLASAYQAKYPDSVVLFYDSEFGSPQGYFESFGVDTGRVLHTPITDIEQLKHDIMQQLAAIDRDAHVMIIIDSIGNLASKKEVEDALDGKSVADMTRAKGMKSLFRMVTPHLTLKDIPMVVINHTYKTMELYSKDVVSGGTGVMYSADNVWIVGRQQEKDGTELLGYNFIINVEKSRMVREKSKIPISVSFTGGISKWSGLLDMALESGVVVKPSNGWYQRAGEEKKFRVADTDNKEFWLPILMNAEFRKFIETKYKIGFAKSFADISDTDIEEEYDNASEV